MVGRCGSIARVAFLSLAASLLFLTAGLLASPAGSPQAGLLSPTLAYAAEPAWSAQTSGVTSRLWDVFFIDADRGWAVGNGGVVLRTTNGGQTWSTQPSGTTANLSNVRFVDANNGWILGTDPPSTPMALKTQNGGSSWTRVDLPPNMGGSPPADAGYKALAVASANTVWIGGNFGSLLRTQDGGLSWTRQDQLSTGGAFSSAQIVYGIHFRDANHGCAVGSGDLRVHTTTGGTIWNPSSLTGPPHEAGIMLYDSLTFMSPLEGWAHMMNMLTAKRGLIHTTDGGVTWRAIPFVSQQQPSQTSFVTTTAGWGLSDGTLLRTQDGGSTWATQARPGTARLRAIFFLAASSTGGAPRGWAVGDSGVIISYGASAQLPGSRCFLDVDSKHNYYDAIEGLCKAKVIEGYPVTGGSEFRPQNNLFRAQFAKMILGVLKIPVTENHWLDSQKPFTDLGTDDPGNLYPHDYVGKAYALGITKGKTLTTFSPYTDVTRAQVITMMVRAAKALKPVLSDPPGGWKDGPLAGYYGNTTHGENVRIAAYNGLLQGIAGLSASWDCEKPATRGEAAQLMWNLYRLEGGSGPQPQVLFSDDFSSKAGGWPETGDAQHQFSYDLALGRYLVDLKTVDWLAWGWLPSTYANFSAEVRATCLSPGKQGFYGLIFRVSADAKEMYQFLVSNQGFWQLWRVKKDGTRSFMTEARDNPSNKIKVGTEWNHIRVTARGPLVEMYINDSKVVTLEGATLSSGRIGLIAGSAATGSAQMGFDDYKIWTAP